MNRSKVYLIVPIVVVAAFIAYYWNFKSGYDAQEAAKADVIKQARVEKLKKEAESRAAAIADALKAQAERKKERAEREAREQKQKDDKENATLNLNKADQESQKLQRQVEKLTADVKTEKDDIKKIEADNKAEDAEAVFLEQYDKAAQENQAKMAAVLTKINEADAAAARYAAEAAKKKEKQ
jgi:colicin import membrane protein